MVVSSIHVFDPYNDCCPFCMEELRRGVPEDGKCGHEELLGKYPHLRFNASDKHTEQELADSITRFKRDRNTEHEWPI